jgi:hypothetical protein
MNNYKLKYLKYKTKYNLLLQQNGGSSASYGGGGGSGGGGSAGGSHTTIPSTLPHTQSWLYMPLIYYALDNTSIELPLGFLEVIDSCITIYELGFTNSNNFFEKLKERLQSKNYRKISDLKLDGDHHIAGRTQDEIFNFENLAVLSEIIANTLILNTSMHGKRFNYNR